MDESYDNDVFYVLGEFGDIKPAVCMTHKRFIPCRTNQNCVISDNEFDVQMIREYQYNL